MACNCGGGNKPRVEYKVNFNDGSSQTFVTVSDAQAAIKQRRGGTMRAVPASS